MHALLQTIHNFQTKHLQPHPDQDEKLQLQIGYAWSKSKQPPPNHNSAQLVPSQQTIEGEPISYYQLALLLFPEIPTESPLDLDILDTLFFLQDHSIHYIFKDQRKGLSKVKNRGITACDLFLKKKLRKKQAPAREREGKTRTMYSILTDERSEKSLSSGLGYMALLRYKDGSFLRLKEADLRAIFTNPLYANERFRHNNCTQYIQALPPEGSEETRLRFDCFRFKDEPLMHLALQTQLGNCPLGDRSLIRTKLAETSATALLHFTVFEIFHYVNIHHNRKLESGVFHFVREGEGWTLAGVDSAVMAAGSRQFARVELWATPRKVQFGEIDRRDRNIFEEREESQSQLQKAVSKYFEDTNSRITTDMQDFLQLKLDEVRKAKDKNLSRTIFQILHPHTRLNLYDLLESPRHLAQLLSPSKPKRRPPTAPPVARPPSRPSLRQQRQKQKEKFIYRGIETS